MQSTTSVRRLAATALLLLGALLTACGSQVPHDEIVAAAGSVTDVAAGTGTVTPSGGSTAGSGTAAGAGAVTATDPGTGATGATGADVGSGSTGSGTEAGGTGTGTGTSPAAVAGPATGSPVVVGNIGSYSGVLGSIFPGGAAAVQAWAQSVNARGGLNGHVVQIVSGDDGGDPSRALSLARSMVEEQGAIALMGNMMPLSLSGIRSYLEQNNIPLVGGDVTLPDWIESPVIFPSGTDVASISVALLNLMRDAGGTNMAMLYCGESPSCGALAAASQRGMPDGMTLAFTSQISIVQTDFTTECLRAKQAGADAIFVAADANTVIRVARSCLQQDLHPLYSTASIAVGPQLADDPNMEGLLAPVNNAPWFDGSTPGGALYLDAMSTYAAGAPLAATGASQFASGLLIEAASRNFGDNPTSADLLAGLRALSGETAMGMTPPLTFHNGPSGPVTCYFVVQVRGGTWTAPHGATPQCL
jgi:branched-chain amino acid transport system substrate-binding protein